jgi:predicted deacetylase
MRVCIDLDDYHTFPKWDCTDVLQKLIAQYPKIRFTLFITPFMRKKSIYDYPRALDRLLLLVSQGYVEIFLHGLKHKKFINGEFGFISKRMAKKKIERARRLFEKGGIPYKEGIKFPWNIYSRGSLKAVEELGFILFSNKYEKHFRGKQIVWKNHNGIQKRYLNGKCYKRGVPDFPGKGGTVYYHGHAQNAGNTGIRESYDYFLNELKKLETEDGIEFIFCSEL